MGFLARADFSGGWVPDADAINAPKSVLLRADNCVLDELGVVAVRQGSAKINGVAFADTDVHSLFTVSLNGTRYRMAGCNNTVYANGSSLQVMAGSGDVAFGSHMSQILFARGGSKYKYDGATVRTWGIAMTGGAPTVAALAADSKVFASCDAGEVTWVDNEYGAVTTQVTGQDGTANGAKQVTPDGTTGRSTITKTFASDQDFTTYAGGETGVDDDIIEMYVYVTEPSQLDSVTVMIDVNSSSTNAFQDDYYIHKFNASDQLDVALDGSEYLDRDYTAEGTQRRRVRSLRERKPAPISRFRDDEPASNAGWTKLAIRRGSMRRVGQTAGKDWSTVRAIRLIAKMNGGGTTATLRYDAVQIVGGANRPLTGRYKHRYVLVRNDGAYLAKSAPSTASAEAVYKGQGSTVTIPADAARDSQVSEVWTFRMGGDLDGWYRVKVSSLSGTGSLAVQDTLSDRDALIANVKLETDNSGPPSDIISIAGPYFDRTCVLTLAGYLYPSRRVNPDSFSAGQVIRVTGQDETAYWMRKALGGLYIGTSKDIYLLEGTGAELPDGTIDFTLRCLNIDHPPIGKAVAQEGNLLVYLADDGWRAITGGGSTSLSGTSSLLYRGQARHGVSAVNLTTGRFVAAIAKGQLVAVTPEGASTSSSAVLHRHVFNGGRWYRHVYPQAFRSIAREPDGTLIAGDSAGFVWILDSGTADGVTAIPVTVWTVSDDDGRPSQRKDPGDIRFRMDTGNVACSVALHLDGSAAAATTVSVTQNGMGVTAADLSTMTVCKQLQLRITGNVATFKFYDYAFGYRERPIPFMGRVQDTTGGYAGEKVLAGYRLKLCTVGAARVITPYLDGSATTQTFTVTTDTNEPSTQILQFTLPQTATDIGWSADGDVELSDWEPIVLYHLPLRVKAWENKPMVPSPVRRRFGGLTLQVHTHDAAVTVTPVVDGVLQERLAVTTSELLGRTLTFDSVVGRDLWCRLTSSTPFAVHGVEPIVLETLPQQFEGLTPRNHFGYPGIKTLSGLQVRVCTLGAAVTLTSVLDGRDSYGVTVTSDEDEPSEVTIPFGAAQEAAAIALSISGPVELYDWQPLVTARRPLGVTAWDSGPLDLGIGDLVWIREIRLKVRASADITCGLYFDGVGHGSVTLTVEPSERHVDTLLTVPVGRGFKGKVPRLVLTSSGTFYPRAVEFYQRTTTSKTAKTPIRIPVSLGGEAA